MKLVLFSLAVIGLCYASVEEDPKSDPLKGQTILGNPKDKPQNGRSLVAVNEQSQVSLLLRSFACH